MLNLIILVATFATVGWWAYKVATYDWSNFEEDSKNDDFLKPYDEKELK
jgi:hypothetical protein